MGDYPQKRGSYTVCFETTREYYDWYKRTTGKVHPDMAKGYFDPFRGSPIEVPQDVTMKKLDKIISLLESIEGKL